MSTTGKLIFTLVIAANLAAIAAVSAVDLHRRAVHETQVIELAKIVVTPAKVEAEPIELAAIVVTPSEADWQYAEANGVNHPTTTSVALAPIVVQPTAEQLAEVVAKRLAGTAPTTTASTTEDTAMCSLMTALGAFSPGQYLDTGAALRAFNVLVFDGLGR
ncbi:MAG TPA: hypothetical protein VJR90_08570 [Gammaproteobacteria bacterium]|nr:hypothetical protein [Gammaproteobacteria bacterium]